MHTRLILLSSFVLLGCGSGGGTHFFPPGDGAVAATPDMAVKMGGDVGDMSQAAPMDDLAMMMGGPGDMACKPPSTLHPPKMGMPSIYCPFSAVNGGKNIYCQQGTQHCCEPAMGTAMCTPIGTACPMGQTDWQCLDPTDCPNGQQCCGVGKLQLAMQGCQNSATGFTGTHCAGLCGANEIQMCTADGECGGKTCVPFATHGSGVGGCN